jgi:thioredoxin-like negative regulator of GroEL
MKGDDSMAQVHKRSELHLLHLLYFRPPQVGCTALDDKLVDVATRYRGQLRLVIKHTDECGFLFGGWVSGRSPTVLLVRDGQSLGQLVGSVPAFEIERLVKSALAGWQLAA